MGRSRRALVSLLALVMAGVASAPGMLAVVCLTQDCPERAAKCATSDCMPVESCAPAVPDVPEKNCCSWMAGDFDPAVFPTAPVPGLTAIALPPTLFASIEIPL